MYIVNIWGIAFCFYVPMIIVTLLAYYEGREEGKRYTRINRVQYKRCNSRKAYEREYKEVNV